MSSFNVTFLPSETRKIVNVNLRNDDIVEDVENFQGLLVAEDPGIVEVIQDTAMVFITDDDGR